MSIERHDRPFLPIGVLSLNPAVDVTYELPCLVPDQKVHALASRLDPGGNGINVGRALQRLGVTAGNFCIVAGEVGLLLRRLLVEQLDGVDYEEVAGETRINVTAIEHSPPVQYEISDLGPAIPPLQLESLLQRFLQHCVGGYAVLSGTLQSGLPVSLYADLAVRIRENGGKAVIDTHDEALRLAIDARPFLIKPNRYEFETLLGRSLDSLEAVAAEARALQLRGVEYVCISLDGEGALLCGPDDSYFVAAPRVEVHSSVGAGDSMVAALVAAFARGASAADALALAVACASGTVAQPGTELFSLAQVDGHLAEVSVRELGI